MPGPMTDGTPSAAASIGLWPSPCGGRLLPMKAASAACVSLRSSPVVSARWMIVPLRGLAALAGTVPSEACCIDDLRHFLALLQVRRGTRSRRTGWPSLRASFDEVDEELFLTRPSA